jgi:hypothetical protein
VTADELKRKADEVNARNRSSTEADFAQSEVMVSIRRAADRGEYQCSFLHLNRFQIECLRSRGFGVTEQKEERPGRCGFPVTDRSYLVQWGENW